MPDSKKITFIVEGDQETVDLLRVGHGLKVNVIDDMGWTGGDYSDVVIDDHTVEAHMEWLRGHGYQVNNPKHRPLNVPERLALIKKDIELDNLTEGTAYADLTWAVNTIEMYKAELDA